MDGKISYDEFCAFTKDIQIQDLFSMNMFDLNNNNNNNNA